MKATNKELNELLNTLEIATKQRAFWDENEPQGKINEALELVISHTKNEIIKLSK